MNLPIVINNLAGNFLQTASFGLSIGWQCMPLILQISRRHGLTKNILDEPWLITYFVLNSSPPCFVEIRPQEIVLSSRPLAIVSDNPKDKVIFTHVQVIIGTELESFQTDLGCFTRIVYWITKVTNVCVPFLLENASS